MELKPQFPFQNTMNKYINIVSSSVFPRPDTPWSNINPQAGWTNTYTVRCPTPMTPSFFRNSCRLLAGLFTGYGRNESSRDMCKSYLPGEASNESLILPSLAACAAGNDLGTPPRRRTSAQHSSQAQSSQRPHTTCHGCITPGLDHPSTGNRKISYLKPCSKTVQSPRKFLNRTGA